MIITYRNPISKKTINVHIEKLDNTLSNDWYTALIDNIANKRYLEKNFCFHGFPNTPRTLEYLCNELNRHVRVINESNIGYIIDDWYHPNVVRFDDTYKTKQCTEETKNTCLGLRKKDRVLNRLHNHFEILQGTVENLSEYYKKANYKTKYAIRQLNLLCHEIETLILSQRKVITAPEWIRPSQIVTFFNSPRNDLTEEHRKLFDINKYDRHFGTVYLHWAQIGKTLFEVFRDENAPKLKFINGTDLLYDTGATCEAITSLKYYTGEFDIEWGRTITSDNVWHKNLMDDFYNWLNTNNIQPTPEMSLGYLPVARVNLEKSFQTTDIKTIWEIIQNHMDVYKIAIDNYEQVYEYCWSDIDYEEKQIQKLKGGYDYSSKW